MYTGVDKKSDTSIFLKIPENEGRFGSRSSSFSSRNDDRPGKLRKAVSLEDVLYRKRRREKAFVRSHKTRRSAPNPRKHTRRRTTSLNSYGSRKSSLKYENELSRRSSKISAHGSSRKGSQRSRNYQDLSHVQEELLSREDLRKHRNRKKLIIVIVGTFCLLVLVSIMTVVVTLTHRSTTIVKVNNFTLNVTHYTFSADPNILCKEGRIELCTKRE